MARQHTAGVDHRRTDTRERILAVALRMFSTRGYTATSLQELADELGVTKAALYFHFKNKEDILAGIMLGNLGSLNAMIDEAAQYASTPTGREEFLRRVADHLAAQGPHLFRLMRENFSGIGNLGLEDEIRRTQRRLLDTLAGPNPTLLDKARARTAFAGLQATALTAEWEEADEDELRAAALTVALEVLRGGSETRNHPA
ncbi:TetR/AcrR family transcriptional regulator [Nocardia alni]|uniref:TetR/AcrR family transcriptional regulator n=1 Tax=Nocardia alni TaxID=2815723 RepID=UPI001C23CCED|nr:TetR/AcrR family transcriptional regulator [Nocardia alni]